MSRRIALALALTLLLAACGTGPAGTGSTGAAPTSVPSAAAAPAPTSTSAPAPAAETSADAPHALKVGLDWTPNTNHTGLYVARDLGYYKAKGLDVEIVQAQEGGTVEQLVAAGRLDFGISYQEIVTQGRAQGLPIVSVAAIIQHNTSGFASRKAKGIASPKDFEGKKYGGFGSPIEEAVLRGLMECAGGDYSKIQTVDIGSSDFFVATERGDVDFAWIFQGWDGIAAQQRGVDINMIMLNDLKCIPDYYTPVLITSEQMIAKNPDLVKRFVAATSQGYQLAIAKPDEAAAVLTKAAPELDANLVKASAAYLAKQYQAEAPRWGQQKLEVWQGYAKWMAERKLIPKMIEPEKAFTNEFLP